MKQLLSLSLLVFGLLSCNNSNKVIAQPENNLGINCTQYGCKGSYTGPEFVNGADIAHQFSNKMSDAVGKKLKELYASNQYSKVDFNKITMSTQGMGSGSVVYTLSIPFVLVKEKCDAFTSFDHSGGWNHKPAIEERKRQLKKALMEGESLYISSLKTTKEGLQEYWIQWKHKITQSHCR